jgi:hypothetical protein
LGCASGLFNQLEKAETHISKSGPTSHPQFFQFIIEVDVSVLDSRKAWHVPWVVMSLEMGGESCTTGSGQPIAMDDVWGQAVDAGANAVNPASGTVKLFEITTELTGVDEKDIPDNQFIVPAGWEQVAGPSW